MPNPHAIAWIFLLTNILLYNTCFLCLILDLLSVWIERQLEKVINIEIVCLRVADICEILVYMVYILNVRLFFVLYREASRSAHNFNADYAPRLLFSVGQKVLHRQ